MESGTLQRPLLVSSLRDKDGLEMSIFLFLLKTGITVDA